MDAYARTRRRISKLKKIGIDHEKSYADFTFLESSSKELMRKRKQTGSNIILLSILEQKEDTNLLFEAA